MQADSRISECEQGHDHKQHPGMHRVFQALQWRFRLMNGNLQAMQSAALLSVRQDIVPCEPSLLEGDDGAPTLQ